MKMKLKIFFISTFLILLTQSTKLKSRTFSTFKSSSHNRENLTINKELGEGTSTIKKGKISEDLSLSSINITDSGILVQLADPEKKTELMELLFEPTEEGSEFLDFRLFLNCDINVHNSEKSLTFSTSSRSLENKEKIDDLEVSFNLSNDQISKLLGGDQKDLGVATEAVKSLLKMCDSRKKEIDQDKNKFYSQADNLKIETEKVKELSRKVSTKESELLMLNQNLVSTENQINDMKRLEETYNQQLKSLNTLVSGTSTLTQTQSEKVQEFTQKEKDITKEIDSISASLKSQENDFDLKKKEYTDLMESSKDIENKILLNQRKLSELNSKISDVKSKLFQNSYEINSKVNEKNHTVEKVSKIDSELANLMQKTTETNELKKKIMEDQETNEKVVTSIKDSIAELDNQINALITQKSKKEEELSKAYEKKYSYEDKLNKVAVDSENLKSSSLELKQKQEKLKDKIENNLNLKALKLKSIDDTLKKEENSFNEKISKVKDEISSLDIEKKNNLAQITKNSEERRSFEKLVYETKKELSNRENSKADISMKKKDIEMKVDSIKLDSTNYSADIENAQKALSLSKENLKLYLSLKNDALEKIDPLKNELETLKKEKKNSEDSVKSLRKNLKEVAKRFRAQAPSAEIIVDMAERNVLAEGGLKWRKLIDQIID